MSENEYVYEMHCNSKYSDFTVWDLNKIIGNGDCRDFHEIILEKETEIETRVKESNEKSKESLKKHFPDMYAKLEAQDAQIKLVQERQAEYEETRDLDSYILFWEDLWKNGGLLFNGTGWTFTLSDLYVEAERYDDALKFVQFIKEVKPNYADRAESSEKWILKLKNKSEKKKNKQA